MLKKYLLYLFLQIKSAFKILPKLILCTFIAGIIVFVAGSSASVILDKDESVSISVAVVMPPDDAKIAMGFDIVSRMESLKSICNFVPVDSEDAALKLMNDGDVSVVAVLPEGMVEAINDGTNIPARLILPENASIEALILGSTIDAGSKTLAYVQSGIYAVDHWLWNHDMDDKVSDAEDYLNDFYALYAFNRTTYFEGEEVSKTGSSSTAFYYICSGFLLVLLMCGLAVSGSLQPPAAEIIRLHRISALYSVLCGLISVSIAFFALFGILAVIGMTFLSVDITLTGLALLFVLIMSVISFIMCISSFSERGRTLSSVLVIFLISAVMMYACGRILPSAFIPKTVALIGQFLPLTYWCSLFDSIISGTIIAKDLIITLIYMAAFLGISVLMSHIRGRNA